MKKRRSIPLPMMETHNNLDGPYVPAVDKEGRTYDCLKCSGMCCTMFDAIEITRKDVTRMIEHLGITRKEFLSKYTTPLNEVPGGKGKGRVFKSVTDALTGSKTTCIFFNQKARLCSIHTARPETCRMWPSENGKHCGLFDALQHVRNHFDSRKQNILITIGDKEHNHDPRVTQRAAGVRP